MQDEITEAVTIAITPAIADAERQRAMRKPPESLDAWGATDDKARAMILSSEIRFAADSSLEGAGFEPSVPP